MNKLLALFKCKSCKNDDAKIAILEQQLRWATYQNELKDKSIQECIQLRKNYAQEVRKEVRIKTENVIEQLQLTQKSSRYVSERIQALEDVNDKFQILFGDLMQGKTITLKDGTKIKGVKHE